MVGSERRRQGLRAGDGGAHGGGGALAGAFGLRRWEEHTVDHDHDYDHHDGRPGTEDGCDLDPAHDAPVDAGHDADVVLGLGEGVRRCVQQGRRQAGEPRADAQRLLRAEEFGRGQPLPPHADPRRNDEPRLRGRRPERRREAGHRRAPGPLHGEGVGLKPAAANVRGISELDWIILAVVGLTAWAGFRRGIIATALSLAGLLLGGVVGARLAPHFLEHGVSSRYTALVGLGCAFGGVIAFQMLANLLGRAIRGGLHLLPPLHLLDSIGGLLVGAAWGLALVWIVGAVVLQIPGHPKWRHAVRQSQFMQRLDQVAPPHDILLVQKRFATLATTIERSGL
jgi:uncharacterized membrane protein required for colicin V production